MLDEKSIFDICRRATQAAYDDTAWQDLVSRIAHGLKGASVGFEDQSYFTPSELAIRVAHEIDPECDASVIRNVEPSDHIALKPIMNNRENETFLLESFCSREEFSTDPSIRYFFHPQKLDKSALSVVNRDHSSLSLLCAFRKIDAPDFNAAEINFISAISAQLKETLHLRMLRLAAETKTQEERLPGTIPRRECGILYTTITGRIIRADTFVEQLLSDETGLAERRGRLVSTRPAPGQDQEALHQFLTRVARRATSAHMHIVLQGPSALKLTGVPIGPDVAPGAASFGSVLAIIVEALPRGGDVSVDAFAKVFELTAAEQSFLGMLAKTLSAQSASDALGISHNTAKTHLRHLFQKTGASTQAGLLMLLMTYQ